MIIVFVKIFLLNDVLKILGGFVICWDEDRFFGKFFFGIDNFVCFVVLVMFWIREKFGYLVVKLFFLVFNILFILFFLFFLYFFKVK